MNLFLDLGIVIVAMQYCSLIYTNIACEIEWILVRHNNEGKKMAFKEVELKKGWKKIFKFFDPSKNRDKMYKVVVLIKSLIYINYIIATIIGIYCIINRGSINSTIEFQDIIRKFMTVLNLGIIFLFGYVVVVQALINKKSIIK